MPITNPGPLPWLSGLTIGNVLEQTASAHPDRDALVFPALGLHGRLLQEPRGHCACHRS